MRRLVGIAVVAVLLGAATTQAATAPTAAPAVDTATLDPETRAAREAETRQKLEALRDHVRELQAQRVATQGEQQQANVALRSTELALNDAARALQKLDAELAERERTRARLAAEAAALATKLADERRALGALLRSAYAQGQYAPLLPLLAPDQVATRARLLGYHRVLNERRAERIAAVSVDLARSRALDIEQAQALAALAQTRAAQAQQAQALEAARAEHRELVATLAAKLAEDANALKALAADERELVQLLERLKDVLADIPKVLAGSEPFAQQRGRLALPLKGTLLGRYGAKLPAGRSSQGTMLGASAGSEVRAIAYGRVAYADWLRGYGLLIIVDHDDGYLSLYAHCEALLRELGDWVQPGDVLARAGAAGVDHPAGIYFELRKNGVAIDPAPWFANR